MRSQVVQTEWSCLLPELERGEYDMAMYGLEIIPERLKRVQVSRPYYLYNLDRFVDKLLRSGDLKPIYDKEGPWDNALAELYELQFAG